MPPELDPSPSVLLVDDDDLYRSGLVALLAQHGVRVVADVASGSDHGELLRRYRPAVVLCAVAEGGSADDASELALVTAAARAAPVDTSRVAPAVAALAATALDPTIWRALRTGATGYVLKSEPLQSLVHAIHVLADGGGWFSPPVAARVAHFLQTGATPAASAPPDMSARELQVLQLLAQGLDNNQIAAALGVSAKTAKNHVSNIIAKLGVRNRVQAAVFAVRAGLA